MNRPLSLVLLLLTFVSGAPIAIAAAADAYPSKIIRMKTLAILFAWMVACGFTASVHGATFASEYELLRKLPTAELSGLVTRARRTGTNQPERTMTSYL